MQDDDMVVQFLEDGLDVRWQLKALLTMAMAWVSNSDPDQWLEAWLAEAAEGDDDYIRWVLRSWTELQHWPSFKLIRLGHEVQYLLNRPA